MVVFIGGGEWCVCLFVCLFERERESCAVFISGLLSVDEDSDAKDAETLLNGYVADFFGATIVRWDELARDLWRQNWTGF